MPTDKTPGDADETLALPVTDPEPTADETLALPVTDPEPTADETLALPVTDPEPTADETLALPVTDSASGAETAMLPVDDAAAADTSVLALDVPAPAQAAPFGSPEPVAEPAYTSPIGALYAPPTERPLSGDEPSVRPAAASTQPSEPAPVDPPRRRLRVGTVVWGLVIAAIGVGLLAWAAGVEIDVQLAMIVLLAVAGTALLVGSIVSGARHARR